MRSQRRQQYIVRGIRQQHNNSIVIATVVGDKAFFAEYAKGRGEGHTRPCTRLCVCAGACFLHIWCYHYQYIQFSNYTAITYELWGTE